MGKPLQTSIAAGLIIAAIVTTIYIGINNPFTILPDTTESTPTTVPDVILLNPRMGETVQGVIMIDASFENTRNTNVTITCNATVIGNSIPCTWNSSSFADGYWNLSIQVNRSNLWGIDWVLIVINNSKSGSFASDITAPKVGILDPDAEGVVRGTVSIRALIWDESTYSTEVLVNGTLLGITLPLTWNTSSYTDGWVNLTVRARDAKGNLGQDMINVVIDNNFTRVSLHRNYYAEYLDTIEVLGNTKVPLTQINLNVTIDQGDILYLQFSGWIGTPPSTGANYYVGIDNIPEPNARAGASVSGVYAISFIYRNTTLTPGIHRVDIFVESTGSGTVVPQDSMVWIQTYYEVNNTSNPPDNTFKGAFWNVFGKNTEYAPHNLAGNWRMSFNQSDAVQFNSAYVELNQSSTQFILKQSGVYRLTYNLYYAAAATTLHVYFNFGLTDQDDQSDIADNCGHVAGNLYFYSDGDDSIVMNVVSNNDYNFVYANNVAIEYCA